MGDETASKRRAYTAEAQSWQSLQKKWNRQQKDEARFSVFDDPATAADWRFGQMTIQLASLKRSRVETSCVRNVFIP
jgi:hypothetical protein